MRAQLLSYNKNFPSNLNYQQANNVKHTKKFCDHCKLSGHRIEECRTRFHQCKKCGETGHQERRCQTRQKPRTNRQHTTHFAFAFEIDRADRQRNDNSINDKSDQWVIDSGATISISHDATPAQRTFGDVAILANGSSMPAIGMGPAKPGFHLSTLLCVPTAHDLIKCY